MNPSISDIKDATCEFYRDNQITRADLEGPAKPYRISRPRQVAMYVALALTTHSLPLIGKSFSRHHATVIHARRSVEAREELLADAEKIAAIIRSREPIRRAVASELWACRAIVEFLSSMPPLVVERDWLVLGAAE